MSMIKLPLTRAAAFAIILGTVAMTSPSFAAPVDPTAPSGPPNSTVNLDGNGHVVSSTPDSGMTMQGGMAPASTAAVSPHHHHDHKMMADHGPGEMKAHVEERIKNLHAKLMITQDQEAQWGEVAQSMRDSEANVSALVQERHKNAGSMNAVDDLESYQAIAEAHSEGLKKVNASFKTLYSVMSDDQKKNADNVFGNYEGHGGLEHQMHHKAAKAK